MKGSLIVVVAGILSVLALSTESQAKSVVDKTMLAVLAQLESSNNPNAVGKGNERGLYQITKAAWSEVMREPFSKAFNKRLNTLAATRYLRLMEKRLAKAIPGWKKLSVRLRTELVIIAWNAGLRTALRHFRYGKCPRSTYRYILKYWKVRSHALRAQEEGLGRCYVQRLSEVEMKNRESGDET